MELDVPNGRLIGQNKGEWGGQLLFRRLDGREHKVAEGNVNAILPFGSGVMVLFGLAHLGLDYGFAVFFESDGEHWWSAYRGDLGGVPKAVNVIDRETIAVLAGNGVHHPASVTMLRGSYPVFSAACLKPDQGTGRR